MSKALSSNEIQKVTFVSFLNQIVTTTLVEEKELVLAFDPNLDLKWSCTVASLEATSQDRRRRIIDNKEETQKVLCDVPGLCIFFEKEG